MCKPVWQNVAIHALCSVVSPQTAAAITANTGPASNVVRHEASNGLVTIAVMVRCNRFVRDQALIVEQHPFWVQTYENVVVRLLEGELADASTIKVCRSAVSSRLG